MNYSDKDMRGAHVQCLGTKRLGTIVNQYQSHYAANQTYFVVRYFNGEPWPFAVNADTVHILHLDYAELDENAD